MLPRKKMIMVASWTTIVGFAWLVMLNEMSRAFVTSSIVSPDSMRRAARLLAVRAAAPASTGVLLQCLVADESPQTFGDAFVIECALNGQVILVLVDQFAFDATSQLQARENRVDRDVDRRHLESRDTRGKHHRLIREEFSQAIDVFTAGPSRKINPHRFPHRGHLCRQISIGFLRKRLCLKRARSREGGSKHYQECGSCHKCTTTTFATHGAILLPVGFRFELVTARGDLSCRHYTNARTVLT
jgi:hypothetical protein